MTLRCAEDGRDARPRVICHMLASVDGRIVADGWPLTPEERALYEQVHAAYAADAWMCGRVTMEQHFAAGVRSDVEIAHEYHGDPRPDHVAQGTYTSYAIAVDARGRLRWTSGDLNGDHLIVLLSSRASDEHLATLRERGVSYILAGADEIDMARAMRTLAATWNVQTLMLEGGGALNGALLAAGLVDEISVLLAPVADGRAGMATLFDQPTLAKSAFRLRLHGVDRVTADVLHLRYTVASH